MIDDSMHPVAFCSTGGRERPPATLRMGGSVLDNVARHPTFRPLEIGPLVVCDSGVQSSRVQTLFSHAAPAPNARSLRIGAVAAVKRFEIEEADEAAAGRVRPTPLRGV